MNFLQQFQALDVSGSEEKQFNLWFENQAIPLRFKPGLPGSKHLFISFHGAIDRSTRSIPAFTPFFPDLEGQAHQLAISDPTMMRDADFSMSWYAGHDGFEAQKILGQLFKDFQTFLEIDNIIFVGTSGGGFAALYYGWHHPGSVTIAGNPQTRLNAYYARHLTAYRETCWPDVSENTQLDRVICYDLGSLYAQSIPNSVIYVQATTDYLHLTKHMTDFISKAAPTKNAPILFDVDYFGIMGHSCPYSALSPWIRAVLMAKSTNPESILQARELIRWKSVPTAPSSKSAPGKSDPSAHALQTANALRDYQLRK